MAARSDTKSVTKDIIMQLLSAFISIALSAAAVMLIDLFSDNGIEAFITALLAIPVITLVSSAFFAAVLRERDVYFPIMLAAVIFSMIYLTGRFGMAYFVFALLELTGFIVGYSIGCYIGKKRPEKQY
ncbi:MAG: hypothetical protein MSJ26_07315 [Oscillospiraceae bacterium]|nr:hypothetical protein [Oscillospiraceae bacterium]